MNQEEQEECQGMLSSFRVLDLADETGYYCGKILADLDAEVIKVERPGGDPSRSIGPFYHDIIDPEKSLNWFAYNRGKKGITLNIETVGGQDIFKRLVKRSDFVIESFTPGYMGKLGLGYSILSQINPRIIMASITPFGQTGPYKDYKASDIVSMAMNGIMFMCGGSDRPPVQVTVEQAHLHVGAEAAIGCLMAHYYRELTGEGQYIDVSAQEVGFMVTLEALPTWYFTNKIVNRAGDSRVTDKGAHHRIAYPCKDGTVVYWLSGGLQARTMTQAMVEQMDSEGMAPDWLKQKNWDEFTLMALSQEESDAITAPYVEYFKMHTKAELYDVGAKLGIPVMPMNTAKDLLENDQLAGRNYWVDIEHPELGTTIKYPGAFVKASEAPLRLWHRAPLIGEHNGEVYANELNLSNEEIIALKECGII